MYGRHSEWQYAVTIRLLNNKAAPLQTGTQKPHRAEQETAQPGSLLDQVEDQGESDS